MGKKKRRDRKNSIKSLEDEFIEWLNVHLTIQLPSNESTGSLLVRLLRLLEEFGERRLLTLVSCAGQTSRVDKHIVHVVHKIVDDGTIQLAKPWICIFQIVLQLIEKRVSLAALAIHIKCFDNELERRTDCDGVSSLEGAYHFGRTRVNMISWAAHNESGHDLNGFTTLRKSYRFGTIPIRLNIICSNYGTRNKYEISVNPTITLATLAMLLLGEIGSCKITHGDKQGEKKAVLSTEHIRWKTLVEIGFKSNDSIVIGEDLTRWAQSRVFVISRSIDQKATVDDFILWTHLQLRELISSSGRHKFTSDEIVRFFEDECRVYSFGLFLTRMSEPNDSATINVFFTHAIRKLYNGGEIGLVRIYICVFALIRVMVFSMPEMGRANFSSYLMKHGKIITDGEARDDVDGLMEQLTSTRMAMLRVILDSNPLFKTQHITLTFVLTKETGESSEYTLCVNPSIKFSTLIRLIQSRFECTHTIYRVNNHKTLEENGFKNNERILVSACTENDDPPGFDSRVVKEPQCKSTLTLEAQLPKVGTFRRKKTRRSQALYNLDRNTDRIEHSKRLTSVFEEAFDLFQERRQRLNDLALDKCPPKQRDGSIKKHQVASEPVNHHCTSDLGGKAGRTFFPVLVGPEEFLYKSSKSSQQGHSSPQKIDLHGYSKVEALQQLDAALPDWMDAAMKSEYPWTVRVDIITGGGSQIVADSVDQWIRRNKNVARRFV